MVKFFHPCVLIGYPLPTNVSRFMKFSSENHALFMTRNDTYTNVFNSASINKYANYPEGKMSSRQNVVAAVWHLAC